MKKLLLLSAFFMCTLSAFAEIGDKFSELSNGTMIYYSVYNTGGTQVEVVANPDIASHPDASETQLAEWRYHGNITIPATVKNGDKTYTVVRIGERAFYDCTELTGVTFLKHTDNAYKVTTVAQYAFAGCTSLKTIEIPESVTGLGLYAFRGSGLTKVEIPTSLKSAASYGFQDCVDLEEVTLHNAMTTIGYRAFYNCTSLKEITIPGSITSWSTETFKGCTSLKKVVVEEGVKTLPNSTFYTCTSLTDVSLPSTLTMIDAHAFRDDSALVNITIPASVTSMGIYAFYNCVALETVTLPSALTSIGNYMFYNCVALETVTLPSALTSIGSYAFSASGLTEITIPNNVETLGSGAFYQCADLVSVDFGQNTTLKKIQQSTFNTCKSLTSITIPNSVDTVGKNAFQSCDKLEEVILGENITCFEQYAFNGCTMLRKCVLPNSTPAEGNLVFPPKLTYLGGYAFYHCDSLTGNVRLPETTTYIGAAAFYLCKKLDGELYIPDGVTYIGNSAFYNCQILRGELRIPSKLEYLGSTAFYYCRQLTGNIVIPDAITEIQGNTFNNCNNITSITLGKNTTTIGNYAFTSCKAVTGTIDLPESVTEVGNQAFIHCNALSAPIYNSKIFAHMPITYALTDGNYTVPDGITTINNYAFYNCDYMKNCTIPESVTTIGAYAFAECTNLVYASIHEGITNIGEAIFLNCNKMNKPIILNKTIVYVPISFTGDTLPDGTPTYTYAIPDTVTAVAGSAFYACKKITKVTLHDGVTFVGDRAFRNCTGLTEPVRNSHTFACLPTTYTLTDSTYTIPSGIKTIAMGAFHECKQLKKIVIPASVDSIGWNSVLNNTTFSLCDNLTDVVWNAKRCCDYTGAGVSPFYSQREYITSFTFGNTVEYLPTYLCSNLIHLKEITIPENVRSYTNSTTFNGCTGLKSVVWNAKNCAPIGAELTSSNQLFGSVRDSITSFTFGDAIEVIPPYLCYNMKNLTSFTMPANVTTIGKYAFSGCTGLTGDLNLSYVQQIDMYAFNNCMGLSGILNIPSAITLGERAFGGCTRLTGDLYLPNLLTVDTYCFYNCKSLTGVTIGNKATSIGAYAFYYCTGLKSLVIGDKVEEIGTGAFNHCTSLKNVTLGKGLRTLGTSVFDQCVGLSKTNFTGTASDWCRITFGSVSSNPVYFSFNLFIDDKPLQECTVTDVSAVSVGAFYNCLSLQTLTIGKGVHTIGGSAFYNCRGLKSVVIGDDVDSIARSAFHNCTGAKDLELGKGITFIGNNAFISWSSLKNLNYTGDIASWCAIRFGELKAGEVRQYANPIFYSRKLSINGVEVANLVVPETVKTIGNHAFYFCQGLQSITIDKSVTEIGDSAFLNCSNVKHVDLMHEALPFPTVGTSAFYSTIYNNATLKVRCPFYADVETIEPWSLFKKKDAYSAHVTVTSNNPAYGAVNVTQPNCETGDGIGVIEAIPTNDGKHDFVRWSDGSTEAHREIEVLEDIELQAIFDSRIIPVEKGTYNLSDLRWGEARNQDLTRCDIVVHEDATLIGDIDSKLENITVSGGATLFVNNGKTLTVSKSLIAQSSDDVQPQIITDGTGAIDYQNFQVVKQIPADRYYFFSLPFDCKVSDVLIDGQAAVYNTDWNYLYYDGAGFAQNPSNESYWLVDETGTIQAGKGYAVGVDAATPDTYRELTFKKSQEVDFSIDVPKTMAVAENPLGARQDDTFKGWNFIVNPYTSNFGVATGSLTLPGIEGDPYVSIPDAGQNQVYTQCRFSEIEHLPPFFGFFVQVPEAGEVVFTPGDVAPRGIAKATALEEEPDELLMVGLTLSDIEKSDETTLVIGKDYTDAYEIGSDLRKMVGYGDKPQVYTYDATTQYAFKSMNQETAMQTQALGVYLPKKANYTFSLAEPVDRERLKAVYLYDSEADAQVNLLHADYDFTSEKATTEKRFTIKTVFKEEETPTALPSETQTKLSVWQDGAGNIVLKGVVVGDMIRIIDTQGRVVAQWVATATITRGAVPVAGLYVVETTNVANVQVHKVVVQ